MSDELDIGKSDEVGNVSSTRWLQLVAGESGVPLVAAAKTQNLLSPSLAVIGLCSALYTRSQATLRYITTHNATLTYANTLHSLETNDKALDSSQWVLALCVSDAQNDIERDDSYRYASRALDTVLTLSGRSVIEQSRRHAQLAASCAMASSLISVLTAPSEKKRVDIALGCTSMLFLNGSFPVEFLNMIEKTSNIKRVALMKNGFFVACTSAWSELDKRDEFTLCLLLRSAVACKERDIPVFPTHSQFGRNTLHRLVTLYLHDGFEVVLLCSHVQPTLSCIRKSVETVLTTSMLKKLNNVTVLHRPPALRVGGGIEGVLFVREHRHVWSWIDPLGSPSIINTGIRMLIDAHRQLNGRRFSFRDDGACAQATDIYMYLKNGSVLYGVAATLIEKGITSRCETLVILARDVPRSSHRRTTFECAKSLNQLVCVDINTHKSDE